MQIGMYSISYLMYFLAPIIRCAKKKREGETEEGRKKGGKEGRSSCPLGSTCQTQEIPVRAQTAASPASGLIES